MFANRRIAVVVPAFNETVRLGQVIQTMPSFVDHILVVDDGSTDTSVEVVQAISRPGLEIFRHASNRGVGAAIETGYRQAMQRGADVAVVMAGDGQMDPNDLPALLRPILDGEADYAKGNRFLHHDVWRAMPVTRLVGNVALSLITKLTSGYFHLFDSQCGYTAASRLALEVLDQTGLFARYGYPNDVLARLHTARLRVADVRVQPIYGEGWRSGIRAWMVFYPLSFVLLRSWFRRCREELGRRRRLDKASPERHLEPKWRGVQEA